jgi:hypothetical protein
MASSEGNPMIGDIHHMQLAQKIDAVQIQNTALLAKVDDLVGKQVVLANQIERMEQDAVPYLLNLQEQRAIIQQIERLEQKCITHLLNQDMDMLENVDLMLDKRVSKTDAKLDLLEQKVAETHAMIEMVTNKMDGRVAHVVLSEAEKEDMFDKKMSQTDAKLDLLEQKVAHMCTMMEDMSKKLDTNACL